jgi:hypothetical protein
MATKKSTNPRPARRTPKPAKGPRSVKPDDSLRKTRKALKLALPLLRDSRDAWIRSYSDASGKDDPATVTDTAVLRIIRRISRVFELAAELGIH